MNTIVEVEYKYGFTLFGRLYCWKDKQLYRMPFNNKLKWYDIKQLKPSTIGKQTGYQLQGVFYPYSQLKRITKEVNHKESELRSDGFPF